MAILKTHWYCVFFIAALYFVLYPPTIVTKSTAIGEAPTMSFYVSSSTQFVGISSESGTGTQRDWPTFGALEAWCLTGFLFFGLRKRP